MTTTFNNYNTASQNQKEGKENHEPFNAYTGYAYRGVNGTALVEAATAKGYGSPEWATMKQWNRLKRSIATGENGTPITVFENVENERGEIIRAPIRAFVFNREQLAQMRRVDSTE